MTRSLLPPPREAPGEIDRFDPVAEGARYRLSAEQLRALWTRVLADATDRAGRRSVAEARRRFHDLAARLAARGGRPRPDVGRLTRVDEARESRDPSAAWLDDGQARVPGRESLVTAHARRQRDAAEPPASPGSLASPQRMPTLRPASPGSLVSRTAPLQRAPVAPRPGAAVQLHAGSDAPALDDARLREAAAAGLSGAGGALPHLDRIQRSFGRHDVTGVRAHIGGSAAQASQQIGALAYASDGRVAFRATPDLHLAAHEAAHIVQQRAGVQLPGGVGAAGDAYERHADAVADLVVAGQSAEALLDQHTGGAAAGGAVQLAQDPGAARASRVAVATSVQATRPTFPDKGGGLLTRTLLEQLDDQRKSVADAVARTGDGARQLGAAPTGGEEPAGVSLGSSAAAPAGSKPQRRAVVVGNAVYAPGSKMGSTVEPTRPLPGSKGDAAAITAALRTRGYRVATLADQTAAQLDSALRGQLAGLGAGSELVFYFSGHGTPEGLIGADGHAFTPAQALALRTQARQAQVDLVFATDACHAGIFADAMRGAELADTRAAAAQRATDGTGAPLTPLVQLLDAAIALQTAKDRFNTTTQQWWARRYELEAAMTGPGATADAQNAWETHYNLGAQNWNVFIVTGNTALVTLHTAAASAGHPLRPLTLHPLGASYDNTGEQLVQAGLDDIDTLTNDVLTFANSRLPR